MRRQVHDLRVGARREHQPYVDAGQRRHLQGRVQHVGREVVGGLYPDSLPGVRDGVTVGLQQCPPLAERSARHDLQDVVRKAFRRGVVLRACDVPLRGRRPVAQERRLQPRRAAALDPEVGVAPRSPLRAADVAVGDVHAADEADAAVDDGYFAVITVCRMIDVGKGERVELDNLDSLLPYFFEMSLLERFIVRPVAERIKHGPYFHAFFHLFGQQIEKRIGYRVIAEIEVFQMNVVFGVADGAE